MIGTFTGLATTEGAMKLSGATFRQLDHWLRNRWIGTDTEQRPGSGRHRRLRPATVLQAAVLVSLNVGKGDVGRYRAALDIVPAALDRHERGFRSILVIEGADACLMSDPNHVWDLYRIGNGVPITAFDLDAVIERLFYG